MRTPKLALAALMAVATTLGGCANMTTQQKNTAIGAAVGAVGGAVLTGGSALGTVGGGAGGGGKGNHGKQ